MKTKFLTLALICMVAMIACDNGTKSTTETETKPGTPGTGTETKRVTVTFPASTFVTEQATLDLTPTYTPTGGWGDFSASDITYTLSDNKGHSNLSYTINASSYNNSDEITFTQTFKQGNTSLASQSFYTVVLNMSGLKFADLFDNDTAWNPLTVIPAITLTLTKPK
jgi:hypothetical protein